MSYTTKETSRNPYYKARIHAAEKDTAYESRLSAGAVVGISSTRLYQIERGLQEPHRDELIVMADAYDAPELLEHYCECVCPVGERCRQIREKK
ncbi:helix-turn-helix domain-containing protein [Mitsuokella multacida]|uniref:helix-turn-helix domain-containing protein n=1 Tax=Mitsuokella multacida TaxID=52226 RepID=UPI002666E692|nr:helix-turn-helix transcriptional regulator [Mitsuokella multacida]